VDARSARRQAPRRPRALATAVAVSVLAVSGCGSNFGAETNQAYNPGPGAYYRSGPIYLLDGLVVADSHGYGVLVGTLTNQGHRTDQLTSVTVTTKSGKSQPATLAHGPVTIAPGAAVQLLNGNRVTFASSSLDRGLGTTMKFTFRNAASFTVQVPVMPRSGYLSTVTIPTKAPKPSKAS
jgi:hypothetical protein